MIFTIGHSNHSAEHFVGLLRQHGIATLADVRSLPYSRWAPQFRKDALARSLDTAGVEYVFLGRELGGRPDGAEFYTADGKVDDARRAQAADFQAGIDRLIELARRGPTAILCAEEDPGRCHRRLLVTPVLIERRIAVAHIRGDGRLEAEGTAEDGAPQLRLFEWRAVRLWDVAITAPFRERTSLTRAGHGAAATRQGSTTRGRATRAPRRRGSRAGRRC